METVAGRYTIGRHELDRIVDGSGGGSCALIAPLLAGRSKLLYQLFVLNILLQIFDGIATYSGLGFGIGEGNPLLRNAFHQWGVAPALLVFKAHACGMLVFVYRIAGEQLATGALGILAGTYSLCSLIPWLGVLLASLFRFL